MLDIESLGLHGSGVMAFLVGLGIQRAETLDCEQYLLVDPDGEAAMLAAIAARISAHRLWLTYNGRSFDIPVLAARCTINRLDPAGMEPRLHGDLLGPVRRLFRDRLGACTLRHAEMSLLNHHRAHDVPGFEAPARYRSWLRGAPAPVLAGVVEHNLQDIVSTVTVGARLAAHVGGERVRPAACRRRLPPRPPPRASRCRRRRRGGAARHGRRRRRALGAPGRPPPRAGAAASRCHERGRSRCGGASTSVTAATCAPPVATRSVSSAAGSWPPRSTSACRCKSIRDADRAVVGPAAWWRPRRRRRMGSP